MRRCPTAPSRLASREARLDQRQVLPTEERFSIEQPAGRTHHAAFSQRPFQGHQTVRLDVEPALERRSFPACTIVSTAQPLGTLAVYLLEPQSADGLAAWNFLDEHLAVGDEYPVYRVRSRHCVAAC